MTDKLGVRLDKPGPGWRKSKWDQTPSWIYEAGMNPTEIALWTFINRRAGHDRLVYSGQADLAKGIGCSVSTVGRTIKAMKEKGLLDYKQVKGQTNRYTLVVPPQFAEDLLPSYLNSETGTEGPGKGAEGQAGEIDPSLLDVPGKKPLDVFLKEYADAVPSDEMIPFPNTWEEAWEDHGCNDLKGLNSLLKYMAKHAKGR